MVPEEAVIPREAVGAAARDLSRGIDVEGAGAVEWGAQPRNRTVFPDKRVRIARVLLGEPDHLTRGINRRRHGDADPELSQPSQ